MLLNSRLRSELRKSLENPHAESSHLASQGFGEWGQRLPVEDTHALLVGNAGKAVRWIPGEGWLEPDEGVRK